jgi:beta-galactosidase
LISILKYQIDWEKTMQTATLLLSLLIVTVEMCQLPKQPSIGVCYYPEHWHHEEWKNHIHQMKQLGIEYVRMGELAWSTIEPRDGVLNWTVFDTVLDLIKQYEMRAIIATPTASPPKWLIDKYGGNNESSTILAFNQNNQVRLFGSRRHYKFSSQDYRYETQRIATLVAKRYGNHPNVVGFLIDNEMGCDDTVRSYDRTDTLKKFRQWLRYQYDNNIDQLNEKWGNAFWSLDYNSFDAIDLPNMVVSGASPSHWLSFYKFSSDVTVDYARLQVQTLRRYIPKDKFITTNFMYMFTDFDHYDMINKGLIDVAGFDSYPTGWSMYGRVSEKYSRTGYPDSAALCHDLYAGLSGRRDNYFVLEQQPGSINWGLTNPEPEPGMVRLWTLEGFAHGANLVTYFRWKQIPYGHEQYHSGLTRTDNSPDNGYYEVMQVLKDLQKLKFDGIQQSEKAEVALLFSYVGNWVIGTMPQGSFSYVSLFINFYITLRSMGINVDILSDKADLSEYKVVIAPTLPVIEDGTIQSFEQYLNIQENAILILGPRSSSKTSELTSTLPIPPGSAFQQLIPFRITKVESFGESIDNVQYNGVNYKYDKWKEWITVIGNTTHTIASFTDRMNRPAIVSRDIGSNGSRIDYIAFYPSIEFLKDYLRDVLKNRLTTPLFELPDQIRIRRRGNLTFVFNYGYTSVDVFQWLSSEHCEILIGAKDGRILSHDVFVAKCEGT